MIRSRNGRRAPNSTRCEPGRRRVPRGTRSGVNRTVTNDDRHPLPRHQRAGRLRRRQVRGARTATPRTARRATSIRCSSATAACSPSTGWERWPTVRPGSCRTSSPSSGGDGASATGCCCSSTSRSTPSAAAATSRTSWRRRDRLREIGAELVRIDRGGDITFHGPGQIVAYPIVELKDPLDLRRYVRTLEAAVIDTAAAFGVTRRRGSAGHPGIWVEGERKLGAIGVRVRRGVTTHGLALNVNTDLRWFDEMIPCGIPDKGVTSLARELGVRSRWTRSRTSSRASWRATSDCAWPMARPASSVRRRTRAVTDERSSSAGVPAADASTASGSRSAPSGRGRRMPTSSGTAGRRRARRRPGHGRRRPAHGAGGANGLRLHLIANSHGHIDHIFDDAPLMEASGRRWRSIPTTPIGSTAGTTTASSSRPCDATRDLREGEQIRIGDLVFDVLHTPGHTEGSVCLYEERRGLLLAGDVLFAGSYGRTDLPGGNEEQMAASLARLAREIPGPSGFYPATARRRRSSASCRGCAASPRPAGSSSPAETLQRGPTASIPACPVPVSPCVVRGDGGSITLPSSEANRMRVSILDADPELGVVGTDPDRLAPSSFALMYEAHRLSVYRYLRAKTSSEDEALDLTAVTFERAFANHRRFRRRDGGVHAWLLRIARNAAIDANRRRRPTTDLAAAGAHLGRNAVEADRMAQQSTGGARPRRAAPRRPARRHPPPVRGRTDVPRDRDRDRQA